MRIALAGNTSKPHDAYLLVAEAAATPAGKRAPGIEIDWSILRSGRIKHGGASSRGPTASSCRGFGGRGIEGMIAAARFARESGTPYFGICLGMQIAVIEFARGVIGWADADSGEFLQHIRHPVIDLMPDQSDVRPRARRCVWAHIPAPSGPAPCFDRCYGCAEVRERHRHQ